MLDLDLLEFLGHCRPMNGLTLGTFPARLLGDLMACLRFYSRLPVPVLSFETDPYAMPDFGRAIGMLPLAGAVIGSCGAAVLVLAAAAKLPPIVSATLSIAILLRVTGCFHEDGLADSADGFGGGSTIARKLEIMKDSRIGTYGAAALSVSLILRIVLIADIEIRYSISAAAASMVAAASVSRIAGLLPLALLVPARVTGAGSAAQRPPLRRVASAAVGALVLALIVCHLGAVDGGRVIQASLAALAAGLYMTALSRRHIAGQTGDVAGAAQQLAEVAFLLLLLAF